MEEELTLEDIPPEVLEMALTEELIEEEDKSLSDEEVLTLCKDDLKTAKKNKVDIDGKISDWRDLAEGKSLGNETEGRSKYVSKETQKAINWLVPNMIKPFTSSNNAAEFQPRTAEDEDTAKAQTTLINYQFNNDFPRYQFLHTAITLFTSEGTTVARTGWIHEEETSSETIPFEGFTTEQVQELEQQGAEINIEDQAEVMVDVTEDPTGTRLSEMIYKGTATITKTTTTVSRPDAESIRNEDFYILGETIEESDACIQRIDTTRGELRDQDKAYNDNGIYENVDLITSNGQDPKEAGLAQTRQTDLETYGAVDPDDISSRDPITIYEYYGLIDRDGSGIPQPIVCVWSGNTILRITDNPFPDKAPPFIGAPYMAVPFSFWGNAMAFYLEDVTKVKSAIMRTFIDLMATSTNGINHIQKGALDPLNLRRLKEAKIGSVIEWNDLGQHKDQVQNEIPQSLQDMYELFTAEGENESGVTRYSQGLDAQSLNKMMSLDTIIPMADGSIKPLGDIIDGDRIIGRRGVTTVEHAHPISYPVTAYEITTKNGEKFKAGEEHYWSVHITKMRKTLKGHEAPAMDKDWYRIDTQTMFELMQAGYRLQLPRAERPEFTDIAVNLPLDPYLLGYWLGDGQSYSPEITTMDYEVVKSYEDVGYTMFKNKHGHEEVASTYTISSPNIERTRGEDGTYEPNGSFSSQIKETGLHGNKHIPEAYFKAPYFARLELIRGLMDSDGSHDSYACAKFYQGDNQLLWDTYRLLKTMGWKVSEPCIIHEAGKESILDGRTITSNGVWQIRFTSFDNPFRIKRKADKWKPSLRYNREPIDEIRVIPVEPMRCLTVSAEDKLFAIGEHWTLTANTATGITAIMNASQMRTWETTTRFAEQFMKPLFRKWIAYNQAFLDKNIALRIVGDQYKEITPDDIKGNFDLIVNIAIAGSEEAKGQKIIGLLQMVSPLVQQGVLPAYHITKLIAELEELAGFKDLAQELKQEADKKEEIRNQAQAAFMQMPEDAQVQVMAMVQQQAQGGQQQQGVPQ